MKSTFSILVVLLSLSDSIAQTRMNVQFGLGTN